MTSAVVYCSIVVLAVVVGAFVAAVAWAAKNYDDQGDELE